jgi:hypothetical protein
VVEREGAPGVAEPDRDPRWGQDVQPADAEEARAVPPVAPSHQHGPGSEHATDTGDDEQTEP